MKRIFWGKKCFGLLAAVLIVAFMSACGEKAEVKDSSLRVVTTIFPEYDWVRNVLGEKESNAELILLAENGVDMHSFQPTADDILKISGCDLFIYVGGESDAWVENVLETAINKNMTVISLMDVLGDYVKEEETVEGMQKEEEEPDHEQEEAEYDEHVWLSLKNAQVLVSAIGESLAGIDPANAAEYRKNAEAYNEKLHALDQEFQKLAESSAQKTLLFGDRFPFRYLTDDYGWNYYAAFAGCSAETEASFETVAFLAKKVDELGLKAVFTIENSDQKIARTIIKTTKAKDQQILSLNSLQSVSSKERKEGIRYLSAMEANLEVIKKALQ